MKKVWLPTWLYCLKPIFIGFVGAALLYYSEDLFTHITGYVCLGYAGWIIIMRIIWSAIKAVKAGIGSAHADKDETHFAKFPDD